MSIAGLCGWGEAGRPEPRIQEEPLLPSRWPRILVVDDDADMCVVIGGSLRSISPRQCVLTESDPLRARSLLRAFQPHVLVTDLEMPGFDGFALSRFIGSDPLLPPVRIVAVTGHVGIVARTRAFLAGVDAYVVKPFTREELRNAVLKVLSDAFISTR